MHIYSLCMHAYTYLAKNVSPCNGPFSDFCIIGENLVTPQEEDGT